MTTDTLAQVAAWRAEQRAICRDESQRRRAALLSRVRPSAEPNRTLEQVAAWRAEQAALAAAANPPEAPADSTQPSVWIPSVPNGGGSGRRLRATYRRTLKPSPFRRRRDDRRVFPLRTLTSPPGVPAVERGPPV